AKGDGVTNDEPAFRSAIAFAYSLVQGRTTPGASPYPSVAGPTVFAPAGVYAIGRRSSTPNATGHNHGIELPGSIMLAGEGGKTDIIPFQKVCTPDHPNDKFLCTGHGLVAGDTIIFRSSGGLTTPDTIPEGEIQIVSSSGLTANEFKVIQPGGSSSSVQAFGT